MATTTAIKSTATTARKSTAARPARKAPSKAVAVKAAVKSAVKPGAKRPPIKAAVKRPVAPKPVGVATKSVQPVKPAPAKKVKLVRDSFSFPEHEHALLADMKKRALKLGKDFKKSEILRAGISHLASLADGALLALLSKVERVKTGRPAKKGKKK